jgi:hypothetical protein
MPTSAVVTRLRLRAERVVCAWCRLPIASSRVHREQRPEVSHGLCRPCARRLSSRIGSR